MRHTTWLTQRLDPPRGREPNPFAFGGGLRNGGLSDQATDLLKDIFSFDYMGAAEFEFGAIPQTLRGFAARAADGKVSADVFDLDDVTVYLIADTDDLDEAEQRVRSWALPHGERPRFKEPPMLDHAIERVRAGVPPGYSDDADRNTRRPTYYTHTIGWIELDNGWFAFVDRDAWDKTCTLFGVTLPDRHKEPTGD